MKQQHNIDLTAEGTIISTLLNNPEAYKTTRSFRLKETDFSDKLYRAIYGAFERYCIEQHEEASDIAGITLYSEDQFTLNDITDISTKFLIATNSTTIQKYIDKLKDLKKRRTLCDMTKQLNGMLQDPETSIEEIAEYTSFLNDMTNNINMNNNIVDVAYYEQKKQKNVIKTGFNFLDSKIKLEEGSFTIVSGDTGVGKSTFIGNLITNMLENKTKCFLYSGELSIDKSLDWIYNIIANEEDLKEGDNNIYIEKDTKARIQKNFIGEKTFFHMDNNTDILSTNKLRELLGYIEHLARYRKIKVFFIDNMMTLVNTSNNIYDEQRKVVNELKRIAMKLNVIIILVAHNKKTKEENTVYNIAGTSDIVNLADNVISLKKGYLNDKNEEVYKVGEAQFGNTITIEKSRNTGASGEKDRMIFNKKTKRFYTYANELNKKHNY